MVVEASTAVAVDTAAAAAARCLEGERGERRRGVWLAVRSGETEERARGTREGGRNRRCHSCGRSEAMEAAGFGIDVSGRRRRRREEAGFGSAVLGFWELGLGRC